MSKLQPFYVEARIGSYNLETHKFRREVGFGLKSTDSGMRLTIKVNDNGECVDYLNIVLTKKSAPGVEFDGTYCIVAWKSQTGEEVLDDEVKIA